MVHKEPTIVSVVKNPIIARGSKASRPIHKYGHLQGSTNDEALSPYASVTHTHMYSIVNTNPIYFVNYQYPLA